MDTASASEALYRCLFENNIDSVFLTDPDGNITAANPAACALFGMTEEELCRAGRPGILDPGALKLSDAWIESAHTGRFQGEVPFIRKDGSRLICDVRSVLLPGDEPKAFIILRDITEQKRTEEALRSSEERLQEALRVSRSFAFEWEPASDRVRRSRNCADLLGLSGTEATEDTGNGFFQRVHPEDRERFVRMLRELRPDADRYETKYRFQRSAGEIIVLEESARAFFDAMGKLCRLIGITTDVTARERAQEKLLESERSARSDAERANRLKDEFLANLSHELRTPLNAILGWTQLLRREHTGTSTTAKGLEVIERNTLMQTQLVSDLLDVSRIISGKMRLEVESCDPVLALEAAIDSLAPAAEARKIRIEKVIEPMAGPVLGDLSRLQQAFWNLLSNAIKFTPEDGRVQITLRRTDSRLEIVFRDNGKGIHPDFLPYLFDRFRRADSSASKQHAGLGLGLAIVKHLVELHGGTVMAESQGEDRGATFTVSLPIF
jgi:PAS domain S-box-containing protein